MPGAWEPGVHFTGKAENVREFHSHQGKLFIAYFMFGTTSVFSRQLQDFQKIFSTQVISNILH